MEARFKRRHLSIARAPGFREWKILRTIYQSLAANADLGGLLQTGADAARRLLKGKIAAVILSDEAADLPGMNRVKVSGQGATSCAPRNHPVFQLLHATGQSVHLNPPHGLPGVAWPVAAAPLIAATGTLGRIVVINRPGTHPFTLHQQRLLETLADRVAWAVQTVRIPDQRARQIIFEERERISQTLHALVAQNLFLLKLEIERLHEGLGPLAEIEAQHLQQIHQLATASLKNVRSAIDSLSHSPARPQRISATLQDMAEEFEKASGISTQLLIHGDDTKLTGAINAALVKVVQEALNNIRKHSHSPSATVSLILDPDAVAVAVHDAGVGFNRGMPRQQGYGLRFLKSLIERNFGSLQVLANDEGGITVRARIPYPSAP